MFFMTILYVFRKGCGIIKQKIKERRFFKIEGWKKKWFLE